MPNVLYRMPFTAVLAIPAVIRDKGARSDCEVYYWHGEALNPRDAGRSAQRDAAEAYGMTLDKAGDFSILFVFKGFHRDCYYVQPERRTV